MNNVVAPNVGHPRELGSFAYLRIVDTDSMPDEEPLAADDDAIDNRVRERSK